MLLMALAAGPALAKNAAPAATQTGIPLNASWKQKLYAFARGKLIHPAWGWSHSERDFRLASEIAARGGLAVDKDVLFAAAFTHDIGAIGEFEKDGVDHAVRSIEIAEPLLREMGFPVQKIPAVSEAILGHMHDKVPGRRNESVVLHDADTVDFLGNVGIARRLSVTGTSPDYAGGLAKIREFADKLPGRLVTATAKRMAAPRVMEMRRFLFQIKAETANGQLP
ncbi:MAG: HD domain-containing protein [Sphingomonas sp.]|nr:HD domain-containing protein [Sphingomonas sp.]